MRFSDLDGARVGVWGAGREIRSFARQLARRLPSAEILAVAFDRPPLEDVREALAAPRARVLDAADSVEGLAQCEIVVRSPGVSIYRQELRALRHAGVKVTTATSLWLGEHGAAGVLGVTGTKGKSTTAALAAQLASAAGRSVRLAGNIGVPALDLLAEERSEIVVLELSSYQIADLDSGPQVALVTNLFKEHSDWHGSESAYREDKLRLLTLSDVRTAVLNAREDSLAALHPPPEINRYGLPDGWDASREGVSLRGRIVLRAQEFPLAGEHNALNLCAALAGLEALGVSPPPLQPALAGFQQLPHRLQTVLERDGTVWVDDSISTTPESTLAALASFPERSIVLIAGGQDRGQDYTTLAGALHEVQATVIGVPSTGARLLEAARAAGVEPTRAIDARNLAEAVGLARGLAAPGTVVLLSPAAPSYDHYRDFEQRGECFTELAAATGAGRV